MVWSWRSAVRNGCPATTERKVGHDRKTETAGLQPTGRPASHRLPRYPPSSWFHSISPTRTERHGEYRVLITSCRVTAVIKYEYRILWEHTAWETYMHMDFIKSYSKLGIKFWEHSTGSRQGPLEDSRVVFDVCVTAYHWCNNVNSQLDATIIILLLIISISTTCFGR